MVITPSTANTPPELRIVINPLLAAALSYIVHSKYQTVMISFMNDIIEFERRILVLTGRRALAEIWTGLLEPLRLLPPHSGISRQRMKR
jgi:hypothetical protein